ncbi:helix-hairpin-helix domain-containing protein [Winogradskyella maritima]|uniref:ComEA family DNA-binding protein n=1 Tax=Winogradskyella maritima TaxID=1517766 RepID=A0ABV8AGB9_9FLAO|nr:helix-hairpin-helix domain-containing protein [Winogradskyella maritima]
MKSHYQFTKQQRSGIFLLVLLIVAVYGIYFFVDFDSKHQSSQNDSSELIAFQNEIDSLKKVELENRKPKIYPFNPNFITDYKGYSLGMSQEEINRLLAFREKDQWINSVAQFQTVTQVSDSLLNKISPYFKFPNWVTNPKPRNSFQSYSNSYSNSPKTYDQKIDLNTATVEQLRKVNGIGEALSKRIIDYRNKYKGGFIADVQLSEIWGLSPEVIERVLQQFTVKTPRQIETFNLNTATIDQLVRIPHIDYEIAGKIIEERTLRDGFKSLDDLTKVEDFPLNKIEIIKLYLQL